MSDEYKHVCHSARGGEIAGPLWFGGWLFTIGFLKLALTKAVFALLLWPYYLGVNFRLPK